MSKSGSVIVRCTTRARGTSESHHALVIISHCDRKNNRAKGMRNIYLIIITISIRSRLILFAEIYSVGGRKVSDWILVLGGSGLAIIGFSLIWVF